MLFPSLVVKILMISCLLLYYDPRLQATCWIFFLCSPADGQLNVREVFFLSCLSVRVKPFLVSVVCVSIHGLPVECVHCTALLWEGPAFPASTRPEGSPMGRPATCDSSLLCSYHLHSKTLHLLSDYTAWLCREGSLWPMLCQVAADKAQGSTVCQLTAPSPSVLNSSKCQDTVFYQPCSSQGMPGSGMKPLDSLGDLWHWFNYKESFGCREFVQGHLRPTRMRHLVHLTLLGLFPISQKKSEIWRLRGGLWLSWVVLFGWGSFFLESILSRGKTFVTS